MRFNFLASVEKPTGGEDNAYAMTEMQIDVKAKALARKYKGCEVVIYQKKDGAWHHHGTALIIPKTEN